MRKDLNKLLRGTGENPYHLSVGGVINRDNTIAVVKKTNGQIVLPAETIYIDESIEDCFFRGMRAELGEVVILQNYIGSLQNEFVREDGMVVAKTIIFFKGVATESVGREPTEDEENDIVLWLELQKALEALEESGMQLFINRAIHYSV